MTKNEYFEVLYESGYRIHVYQSEFMDFCEVAIKYVVQCENNPITGIKTIETLKLSLTEKVGLIYNIYWRLSTLQKFIGGYYMRLRQGLRSSGWMLPEWFFEDARLGPLPSMPVFDRITADVARSSPGDMFFVWLGIPHWPYVYDSMCNTYHPMKWERPTNLPPMKPNDSHSRARRYGRYLEQVRCLHRKLDAMFQAWKEIGIFERLLIVVHGDHGSKILEHGDAELAPADYLDTFSTLFAVKEPGLPAGYDRRIAAVQELLEEVVARQNGNHETHTEGVPYVFRFAGQGKPMLRELLPAFGDGQ